MDSSNLLLNIERQDIMKIAITSLIAIAVLSFASLGWSDFILTGNEYLELDSSTIHHDVGILYDSSSVDIKPGGSVDDLYANDSSSVSFSGGEIRGRLFAYDTSSVDMSGGTVTFLHARGSGTLKVSGGDVINNLRTYGNSNATIIGGTMDNVEVCDTSHSVISGGSMGMLYALDSSLVTVSGGEITKKLLAEEDSKVMIYGGSMDQLSVSDSSNVTVAGGTIPYLNASDTSLVTLYGYDFRVTAGLSMDNGRLLGTGILTGKWWTDEALWSMNISSSSNATVQVVSITNPIFGDANHDGIVNDIDAMILATYWQTAAYVTWEMGDFNGDGDVDDIDATLLAVNWQQVAGEASSIPEPSAIIALVMGSLIFGLCRWRIG
ncbi:MAG: hypothetical protein JW829_03670 [Pirellulales bacterium]|nr:hypothetical protein [Pirellulales bacterium]